MAMTKSTVHRNAGDGPQCRGAIRRLGAVLVSILRTACGALNPLHRKAPTKGPAGVANLVLLLVVLGAVSGFATQATGLRDVALGLLAQAEVHLRDSLRGLFLDEYRPLADALASSGRIAVLGLAILAQVAWVMSLGNFTEAAILGILATYQGKVLISLIEVSLIFALPITLTSLLLSTGRSTCLILLGFLAVQLAYLRWNIDAKLARLYLARIAAIRGGLSSLELEGDPVDSE
jgi:hypothetical protein